MLPGYTKKSRWNLLTCLCLPAALLSGGGDITPGVMEAELGSPNFELITDDIKGKSFYLATRESPYNDDPLEFYFFQPGSKSKNHSILNFTTSRGGFKKPNTFDIPGDLFTLDAKIAEGRNENLFFGTYVPKNKQQVFWNTAMNRSPEYARETEGFFFGNIEKKGITNLKKINFNQIPSIAEELKKVEDDRNFFSSDKDAKDMKLKAYTMINNVYSDENEIVIMLEILSPIYDVYFSNTGSSQSIIRGYRHKRFAAVAFHPETQELLWDVTFAGSHFVSKSAMNTVDYIKTETGFLFAFSNGYQILINEVENGKLVASEDELVTIPGGTKSLINDLSSKYKVVQWYDGAFVASGYQSEGKGSSEEKIFFISKLEYPD